MILSKDRLKELRDIFGKGVEDGYEQGDNFSSGMTYPNPDFNEVYDMGVNFGQFLKLKGKTQ